MCQKQSADPTVKSIIQQEPYLRTILWQQAQQLAGKPGWPRLIEDVYQLLLNQIEADLAPRA